MTNGGVSPGVEFMFASTLDLVTPILSLILSPVFRFGVSCTLSFAVHNITAANVPHSRLLRPLPTHRIRLLHTLPLPVHRHLPRIVLLENYVSPEPPLIKYAANRLLPLRLHFLRLR